MFNYTRFNNTKYYKASSYLNRVQESLNLYVKFCNLKATNTNTQTLSDKNMPRRQTKQLLNMFNIGANCKRSVKVSYVIIRSHNPGPVVRSWVKITQG